MQLAYRNWHISFRRLAERGRIVQAVSRVKGAAPSCFAAIDGYPVEMVLVWGV